MTVAPKADLDSIFEVLFDKCVLFRGREQLLETMEIYFDRSGNGKPSVYALTGLGGAGKTHSALQYALRNRFKYTDGVVYFNASSDTTLIADFHRIYDLLGLGSAPNKVDFLRQWFSKPKIHKWLMIFDGADDLESVSLSRYFPSCSWGHIIVTSRDQAAVGLVAPAGQTIEPLEEQAAIGLLFEKSAISVPTLEDIEQATAIVRSLGFLPLAVDQAGAFIRRRGKSLKDYHRLFENKQYEVLNITPGISGYEKTVATAWELNFRQLEEDGSKASDLLILFSFLEAGKISESMLLRGCSPKRIWGQNGEITELSPEDAGLNPELVSLLNNEMQLDHAIEQLLEFSLIERNNFSDEKRAFSVHPLVQYCASNRVPFQVREKWRAQAILLVAHAFPFNVYIDQDFGNAGREMFAHVPRILKEFDQIGPDCDQYSRVKHAVCMLLISATRFRYNPWRRKCIHRINGLLKDEHDCYLKAQAAFTESKLLRMQGKVADSYNALEEHIHGKVLPGIDEDLSFDARWNATQGDLIISFSENLMRENNLQRAQVELEGWRPLAPSAPSTMENIVLRSRNVMLGRIFKDQGRFQEALPYFEKLPQEFSYEDYQVSTGWQMALFSNIADIYCELGRPDDAEAVLTREMEIIYARGWQNISTGRRLQLALIESFIRRGIFKKAEECLSKLIPTFKAIIEPDMIQNTGHFRVWAGLARVSHLQGHWDDALVRWYRALSIVESAGWTEGFSHGIIHFSIAQVLTRIGNPDESHVALESAKKSLAAEDRKYWIVGLGSYWYDYVVTSLGETGPSPVVMRTKETSDILISQIFGR